MNLDIFFDEDGYDTIDEDGYFYQDQDGDACMTSSLLNYLLAAEHSDVMRAIECVRATGITKHYRPISIWVAMQPAHEMPRTREAYLIKPAGLLLLAPHLNLHANALKFAQELADKFSAADKRLKDMRTEINRVFSPTPKQATGDNNYGQFNA